RAYVGGLLGARSRLAGLSGHSGGGLRARFLDYLGAQHAGVLRAIEVGHRDGATLAVRRLALAAWLLRAPRADQTPGLSVPSALADYGGYRRAAREAGALERRDGRILTMAAQEGHWTLATTVMDGALRHRTARA